MRQLILLAVVILGSYVVNAQGCSDAGFCTLGSLKSNFNLQQKDSLLNNERTLKNTIGTGLSYGLGEDKNNNFNPFILYSREIGKHLELQTKLTSAFIEGKIAHTRNISDIYIAANTSIQLKDKKPKQNQQLNIIAGIKIPFSKANFQKDNLPLPMAYQPSLATLDLIAGVNYIVRGFEINGAIQVPTVQINKNSYFKENSVFTFNNDKDTFASTNLFKRKPDILVRLGYVFHTANYKWLFKPNVLNIVHLGQDTYRDQLNAKQKIKGSQGYTLNAAFNMTYMINKHHNLEFSAGTPLIVREVRPDGLTRKVVVAFEYHFNF